MAEIADVAYKQYSVAVQSVLVDYQFLEEGLRMYAAYAYELIRTRLGEELPFKYSYVDTEKDALGKLIARFEKFSDEADLIKELKELVQHRNSVAHESFLLTKEQHDDVAFLDAQTEKLNSLKQRTGILVKKIFNETGRIEELLKVHHVAKGQPT